MGETELHSPESRPVRYREKAIYYIDSSARNYADEKGVLDITLAQNPVTDTRKNSEFWKYNSYED